MNQDTAIFIQANEFGSVVYKMSTILSRPKCVNITSHDATKWRSLRDEAQNSVTQAEAVINLSDVLRSIICLNPKKNINLSKP